MKKLRVLLIVICLITVGLFCLNSCGSSGIEKPSGFRLDMDTQTISWDKIPGAIGYSVTIGDKEKVMLTDNRLPLVDFAVIGKTKIELTLINNLRNILGPHHLKEGESYVVGPWTFFKEKCIWAPNPEEEWDDGYCFVETGI